MIVYEFLYINKKNYWELVYEWINWFYFWFIYYLLFIKCESYNYMLEMCKLIKSLMWKLLCVIGLFIYES